MAKGPIILKISGIVMFFQSMLGFFIVFFTGLSLISMLGRRNGMKEQLMSFAGILSFLIFGLVLLTSIALIVCAMKSFNTYNHYLIPGGNEKYLLPSRYVLVLGAISFFAGFGVILTPVGSTGIAILIVILSTGWVFALLNLILVKKDREEREKEEPKKVKLF